MKHFLILAATLVLSASNASACSCKFGALPEYVESADEIFVATLLNAKLVQGDYPEKWPYIEGTFQTKKSLKGVTQSKEVVLKTGLGGGDCGVSMSVSQTYIIFKGKDRDGIDICSGSGLIYGFQEDELVTKVKAELSKKSRKPTKN